MALAFCSCLSCWQYVSCSLHENAPAQVYHGNPIFNAIKKGNAITRDNITIHVQSPIGWESFATRVHLMDPCKGCMDPDELTMGDILCVKFDNVTLKIPIFTTHLCDAQAVMANWLDEDEKTAQQEVQDSMFDEAGTNTGFFLWDSAVHVAEYLLSNRDIVKGKNVLELGCGLGLPGFVCSQLGASKVGLTDRPLVVKLCSKGICLNGLDNIMFAESLEWRDGDALALKRKSFGGHLDVIIACDCIFAPLFGDNFLLLQMLDILASVDTLILLGVERRAGDGAEGFFTAAKELFSIRVCWAFNGDPKTVAIYELRRIGYT